MEALAWTICDGKRCSLVAKASGRQRRLDHANTSLSQQHDADTMIVFCDICMTDSFVMSRESSAVNLKGLSEEMAQLPKIIDSN